MVNTENKVQPIDIRLKCPIGIITMFRIIKKSNVAIFYLLLKKSLHLFCNQNSNLHNKSSNNQRKDGILLLLLITTFISYLNFPIYSEY